MELNLNLTKGFDIRLKNDLFKNMKSVSVTLKSTFNSQTKEATTCITNDPNVLGLSLHTIKHNGKIDIMSLTVLKVPHEDYCSSRVKVLQQYPAPSSTSISTAEGPNTANDQNTLDLNLPSTSSSAERKTPSEASTSGINSRKRSLKREPQSQVKMQPKVEKKPRNTFTTGFFVDLPEPQTPALPKALNDILIRDVLLTAVATSSNDVPDLVRNELSSSTGNCLAPMYLDDNSNYSSVLTEEDTFDSFYESLMN